MHTKAGPRTLAIGLALLTAAALWFPLPLEAGRAQEYTRFRELQFGFSFEGTISTGCPTRARDR